MLDFPIRLSFANLPTSSADFEWFLPSLCRQHTRSRIIACCDEGTNTHPGDFFPSPFKQFVLTIPFTKEASQWMTVEIALQR